jgi:hypothetical protein
VTVGFPTRRVVALVLALALAATSACAGGDRRSADRDATDRSSAGAPEGRDAPDPVTLASDVYVAGYPMVVSMRTLQRFAGLIGVNRLFWQTELAGPGSRTVVAPNRDTLYSIAVLDLRAGPVALTLPEITDRYYTYQFLDVWTESFAYIGTRATGGRAGTWVIAPPGWDGTAPAGTEVIEATTPLVFLLGRFLVDDEADVTDVTAISDQVRLEPLAPDGAGAPPPLGEPAGTPQDIPARAAFYDELGDALAISSPTTPAQRELFGRAERLGVGAGAHPTSSGTAEQVTALVDGARRGHELIADAATAGSGTATGWSLRTDVGRYGDDTLQRAVVARVAWGANVPEEAIYPVARVDDEGQPLSGEHRYRITFGADRLPPVDAFWSLSVYGTDMFFTPHPTGRYSIGDRTPGLVHADDGSIEILLAHTEPDPLDDTANWLPVPQGDFVLLLRLYLPRDEVVDGDHPLPRIERIR